MVAVAEHAGLVLALLARWAALSAGREHVFVGVGGALRDAQWIEGQRSLHGVAYRPVMVNPHPRVREVQELARFVQRLGGAFYPNAAWTADGVRMQLHLSPVEVYKGGLDSVFRVRGRHSTRVNVTSVDLARIMREHTAPGDVVVMRMDVEGSEYELLRHLLLQGMLCRLTRLYLETHAMGSPALNAFRNFDVLLPWLVAPCGTEVFVDANYHSIWESKTLWPKGDGACRQCPALYATLPGTGAAACPSSALPACFDAEFGCERCCNLRRGPRGDTRCWARAAAAGGEAAATKRLASGVRGHPLPDDVLARLGAEADRFAFKRKVIDEARAAQASLTVFSYEMCCAGMLGLLSADLASLVSDREQHEAFSPENPRFSLPAAPACPDVAGAYEDSGGGTVLVTQSACQVTAANTLQRWSVAGSVGTGGIQIPTWELAGALIEGGVSWPNGAVWVRGG